MKCWVIDTNKYYHPLVIKDLTKLIYHPHNKVNLQSAWHSPDAAYSLNTCCALRTASSVCFVAYTIWWLWLHLAKKLTGAVRYSHPALPAHDILATLLGAVHTLSWAPSAYDEMQRSSSRVLSFCGRQTSNVKVTSTEHPGWQYCWKSTPILSDSGVYAFSHCNRLL